MANEEKSLQVTTKKGDVVKFADLSGDVELAFKNDKFKALLNQKPRQEWLKEHPTATKKVKDAKGTTREVASEYLPIDKVEFMLDYIFQEWRVEIMQVQAIFNSIAVTVRVHYKNPMTLEWSFHDGVGAAPAQLNKDAKAFDLSQIKSSAVQIGLPAAESYAIKDACEHLGKLFGRDVNRADTISFQGAYSAPPAPPESSDEEEKRLIALIGNAKSIVELEKLKKHLTTQQHMSIYDAKFRELKPTNK